MNEPSIDQMEARLQALYRVELERAAADLEAMPMLRRTGVAARSGLLKAGFSAAAIAAILLVAFALRPGAGPSPRAGAPTVPTPATTADATASPTVPTTQPGWDGIPAAIDGQLVLTGAAIADAIANATDDTAFLIGGWFPAGGGFTYCTALAPGPASCTPYRLHLSKGSEDSILVYPAGASSDISLYMATQPVVMRVHTHDARCMELPNVDRCDHLLVLEEIVWLGPRS